MAAGVWYGMRSSEGDERMEEIAVKLEALQEAVEEQAASTPPEPKSSTEAQAAPPQAESPTPDDLRALETSGAAPDQSPPPVSYLTAGFTGEKAALPEGEIEGLQLTERGLELGPDAEKSGDLRVGTWTSPPRELDFPSNAAALFWKAEASPEGGEGVFLEVAFSPDGETFGDWFRVHTDHDSEGQIREFYPDGTANPNYGYTPGGMFAFGTRRYPQVRWRVTLWSGGEGSPAFEALRMLHTDTAGADAVDPAEPPSPGGF